MAPVKKFCDMVSLVSFLSLKMVSGIGQCGRRICCSNNINIQGKITINMAKNQNLALNTQKFSGQCGNLLCCLKYEDDLYTEAKKNLPAVNSTV